MCIDYTVHHTFMKLIRSFSGAIFAVSSMLLITVQAAEHRPPARYLVRDLGTLPGGHEMVGSDINNLGQVTGVATVPNSDDASQGERYHNFLYQWGSLRDLPLLPGYTWGLSGRINDRGDIIASQTVDGFQPFIPVLYTGGKVVDLSTILGAGAYPSVINNRGVIFGSSRPPDSDVFNAFTLKDGVITYLGALVPGGESDGWDINDSGDAVGWSTVEPGRPGIYHAVRFSNGQVIDLGLLPGMESGAAGRINRAGHIMGNFVAHDFALTRGFLHRDGALIDIGALPGDMDSLALAFNNHDHIVGISSRVQPVGEELWLIQRAMIYAEGRMWDLNTLIPRHSGWKLTSATGINDQGQIVGEFKPIQSSGSAGTGASTLQKLVLAK